MSFNSDWRITDQMDYLKDKELKYSEFKIKNTKWDHEHCRFCWEKILETDFGYCTLDQYHWVCERCFEDFKKMFSWKVV